MVERYRNQAPELLNAVTAGHDGGHIMRRDEKTDYCVKFDNGLCSIHREYGSDFLGDACHFYPRVTRRLGDTAVMTAALSCPEVARLSLFADDAFLAGEGLAERLPATLRDYLPVDVASGDALAVHQAFVDAALNTNHSASHNLAHIISVAHSLEAFGATSWPMAVPFYLKSAGERLPAPETASSDPFNLLHALMGIVSAVKAEHRHRLLDTIRDMEKALLVTLDWQTLGIRAIGDNTAAYEAMEARWNADYALGFEPLLRRWIAVQLSIALFPFAGFGHTIKERALLLGVRFATLRLALMCACEVAGKAIDDAQTVRIVQSLARVLDHLADPELSLKVYEEPGWLRESRLRGLIGDKG